MARKENEDRKSNNQPQGSQSQGSRSQGSQSQESRSQSERSQDTRSSQSAESRKPSGREQESRRPGASGESELSFRCKDAGYNDCDWKTSGRNEDEILRNVERHGRESHNIQNFDDNLRNKVRASIRREAA